jgi:hypothetical protein
MATGGWSVLGSLTKTDEGLEVCAFRAVNLPAITPYRDRNAMECEHCKAKRNRAKTLVIRNDAGKTMQVGRECAHNYVTDISSALSALEFQDLLVSTFSDGEGGEFEYGFSGARTLRAFDTEEALAEICACIRRDGRFIPSKTWVGDSENGHWEVNDDATWRTVRHQMIERKRLSDDERAAAYADFDRRMAELETSRAEFAAAGNTALVDVLTRNISAVAVERGNFDRDNTPSYPIAEADALDAADLIAWISNLELTESDEFLTNLKDLVTAGFVSERRIAFLAALPGAKTRWIRNQERVSNPPTTPAPVGRIEVSGEIISVKERINEFTGTSVYKMLVLLSCRNKVYCSLPSSVNPDSAKGKKIKFVARFERSQDDEHFSFGSRPKLVEIN